MDALSLHSRSGSADRRRGFSMTELLVVIGIIAVLAGILLVAMRGVRRRALYTQTESVMQGFISACDAFQMEHGRYPGAVPETILAANPLLSGTENALLELMGGFIRRDDPRYDDFTGPDWQEIIINGSTPLGRIKVNRTLIGEGPTINGKPYAPYFTPGTGELIVAEYPPDDNDLPDLVDAWGQPIAYVRRARSTGPLAGPAGATPAPQFLTASITPYTGSTALGEIGQDQTDPEGGSVLNLGDFDATFAQIIRHPAFGEPDDPLNGTARGAYSLFSAGPDGIYFSRKDGPGSPAEPVNNIVDDPDFGNPRVVEEYDDIRRFGGG
ncbi:MAG: type II secretion system protein [Planctomycetota bacterium]|jgi:prepilin-type N-terminal cleavage/methylation domain-containing protein